MEQKKTLVLLKQVQQGKLSPEEAVLQLKMSPFEDLGYAKIRANYRNRFCHAKWRR